MTSDTSPVQPTELLHPSKITSKQWLILLLGMLANMIEGFDILVISFTAPAITQDWGVSAEQMGLVLSSGVLGMTLGAMFLSPLADRYGRRNSVSWALLVSGVTTAAVMMASTITELIILRLVAGLALGLLVASLSPLIGEFSPIKHRIFIISMLVASASVGAVLGGLFTAAILASQGWQMIFFYAGVLTLLIGVLIHFYVPESIAFTLKRNPDNALEKVNATLRKIGQQTVDRLPQVSAEAAQESASVTALLATGRRRVTLLTWSAFFTGFVVVYFISSWMPQVLSDAGLSQERAIQATSAIPFGSIFGTILMGWLARWVSLGRVVAIGFVLGTVCIAGMSTLINDIAAIPFPLLLGILFFIGISLMGSFSNMYNVVLIVYPAQIRSTGLGWAAGLGRAGAVISPMLAGVLISVGFSMPALFIMFALPALAAAVCVLLIPMKEMQ